MRRASRPPPRSAAAEIATRVRRGGVVGLNAIVLSLLCAAAQGQSIPNLSLESLPRPATPPPEVGLVVPAQVQRWRLEAIALEHGDGVPRNPVLAAQLYCRAARHGDAEAQFNLAWMLINPRGIERDDAQAAHLFAAAAEQGLVQAQNMLASMGGTPQGPPPACLRPPETDRTPAVAAAPARSAPALPARPPGAWVPLPPPTNAPPQIVTFVRLVAPEYQLEPQLVLSIMAIESNFDPMALSPKGAQGLMQLIPGTAQRFRVRDATDPVQNIRGGMAYLRWLLAYFEGDVALAAAAYNAGERSVERYLGVPPYAETRAYVRRLMTYTGGQRLHRYDASATPPSGAIVALRGALIPAR